MKTVRKGGFHFAVGLGIRGLCPERVNPFRPTRHSEPSGNWIILNLSFRLKKTATLVYAKSEALDYYISQVLLIYLNTIQ